MESNMAQKKPIKIQIFKMNNNELFQEKGLKTCENFVISYTTDFKSIDFYDMFG